MHGPICGADMITGDVVCKPAAGPTLYPRDPADSEARHFRKLLFGSKDSFTATELESGWYCPQCEKILIVWAKKGAAEQ